MITIKNNYKYSSLKYSITLKKSVWVDGMRTSKILMWICSFTRLNSEREMLLEFQLYIHSTWNKCNGSIHQTLKISLISIPEGENISAWERRKTVP